MDTNFLAANEDHRTFRVTRLHNGIAHCVPLDGETPLQLQETTLRPILTLEEAQLTEELAKTHGSKEAQASARMAVVLMEVAEKGFIPPFRWAGNLEALFEREKHKNCPHACRNGWIFERDDFGNLKDGPVPCPGC